MDLLNEYLALTDDAARQAFLEGLTDEQLAEVMTAADEAFADAEAAEPSDENLATLSGLADTIDAVAGVQTQREEAAAEREAQRQALITRVRGEADPAPGEGEEEAPAPGEGDTPPADTPPAPGEGEEEQTPEAIAAAAAAPAVPARPRLTRVQARTHTPPPAAPAVGRASLVAGANIPGITAGTSLVAAGSNDFSELATAMEAAYTALAAGKGRRSMIVASARGEYPDERQLGLDAGANMERINRAMRSLQAGGMTYEEALVAAGGFCAPATVRYDLPVIGDNERPVRDSLLNFGATRGRVRWMPSPMLADAAVHGAVDQWTEADDIAALTDESVVKPCARVECPDELDAQVYAVTRCLEFGNFNARTYPEQIEAFTTMVGVWHARYAEQLLLAGIAAGSTAVNTGQLLSTVSDFLAAIDRIVVWYESFYRIREPRIRFILPEFLHDMIRTDLARMLPGTGTTDERYAIADAQIDRWLTARNVSVTWTLDLQVFGDQGTGPVIGMPSTITGYAFLEGTWSFLDGGTLDLGMVRDSILNRTNDFQMFAETFEGVAKFGPGKSLAVTMDVCSNGQVSGTVDIDPCTTGS